MSEDIQELRVRIAGLSDDELIEMVTVAAGDYRQDALDCARSELRSRGVDFSEVQSNEAEPPGGFEPFPTTPPTTPEGSTCVICGGQLRAGTLVAEKELTIIFSDTREERFIKVGACVRCGTLSFAADYDTNVGS